MTRRLVVAGRIGPAFDYGGSLDVTGCREISIAVADEKRQCIYYGSELLPAGLEPEVQHEASSWSLESLVHSINHLLQGES